MCLKFIIDALLWWLLFWRQTYLLVVVWDLSVEHTPEFGLLFVSVELAVDVIGFDSVDSGCCPVFSSRVVCKWMKE